MRVKIGRRGDPYVCISKDEALALMAISQEWRIVPDFANNPPLQILPATATTTKSLGSEADVTLVTSIRVRKREWEWFKNECRASGTSTCREIRKWIHLAQEEANYPTTLRRAGPGRYVG